MNDLVKQYKDINSKKLEEIESIWDSLYHELEDANFASFAIGFLAGQEKMMGYMNVGKQNIFLHNPDGLTDDILQSYLGYRFLNKSEVDGRIGYPYLEEIEIWIYNKWESGKLGTDTFSTYRTKLSVEQLAAKRAAK